jgi:hypothetical protein
MQSFIVNLDTMPLNSSLYFIYSDSLLYRPCYNVTSAYHQKNQSPIFLTIYVRENKEIHAYMFENCA